MPASEQQPDAPATTDPTATAHDDAREPAGDILRSTAEQDRATSLEVDRAERTVDELAEGAERAADQDHYGREGS